jgi:hypothetical protein
MRSTMKWIADLVLSLATFSPQGSASAEGHQFQVQGAEGYFYNIDSSGCIVKAVVLETGKEGLYSISLLHYDVCTGIRFVEAYGNKLLTKPELKYQGNLDSLTLTTTVHVTDDIRHLAFDISINLQWTGEGDINTYQQHYNYSPSPGCHVNLLIKENYRSATVSGTVYDGVTNYTPEPATQGKLSSGMRVETSQGCE